MVNICLWIEGQGKLGRADLSSLPIPIPATQRTVPLQLQKMH